MPTENPPDEARETPQSDAATTDAATADAAQPIIHLNRSQTHPLAADAPPTSEESAAADEPLDIGWRDAGDDADAAQSQAAPQREEIHEPGHEQSHKQSHKQSYEREFEAASAARLIVVGVGGAGCNIVNHMIESGMGGVKFLAVNTDTQALSASRARQRICIGERLTRGMGTGGDPVIDRGGGEVIFQHDVRFGHPVHGGHRVVCVGDHQEGKIRGAEEGRQAQPHLRHPF